MTANDLSCLLGPFHAQRQVRNKIQTNEENNKLHSIVLRKRKVVYKSKQIHETQHASHAWLVVPFLVNYKSASLL